MKLIIDIPDEILSTRHYCRYFGAWSTKLTETIENGIPYEERPTGKVSNKETIEKIDNIFSELGVWCAFDRPSFWTKNMSKYVVIDDKYHKGYQQALEDAERRIKEIFEEVENGNEL